MPQFTVRAIEVDPIVEVPESTSVKRHFYRRITLHHYNDQSTEILLYGDKEKDLVIREVA